MITMLSDFRFHFYHLSDQRWSHQPWWTNLVCGQIVENYWNGEIETAALNCKNSSNASPFDTNFSNIYTSVLRAAGNIFAFGNLGLGDFSLASLSWVSNHHCFPLVLIIVSRVVSLGEDEWEKVNPWVFVSTARGRLSCSLVLCHPTTTIAQLHKDTQHTDSVTVHCTHQAAMLMLHRASTGYKIPKLCSNLILKLHTLHSVKCTA